MSSALTALRRVVLCAVFVALVTGLGNRPEPKAGHRPQLDVLIAVDRTTSMSAVDDPSGGRIVAARRDLLELVDHLPGARIEVVTFGREARLAVPLTSDLAAVESAIGNLQVELAATGAGSALDRPVPLLTSELDRTGAGEDRVAAVVLVSDGEATAPSQLAAYERVGGRIKTAAVLGYGTSAGGVMPAERLAVDGSNAAEVAAGPLVTDSRTGQAAMTRLDPDSLRRIAHALGGSYVPGDGTQDMTDLASDLVAAAYGDEPPTEPERELRWLWALVMLALVLPELVLGWRGYLEAQREARR